MARLSVDTESRKLSVEVICYAKTEHYYIAISESWKQKNGKLRRYSDLLTVTELSARSFAKKFNIKIQLR